jgi:hypothetical protein
MNGIVPQSLVGYRQELEEAIRRDLATGRARRRRKLAVRTALAVAALAAVALVALSLVSRPASGASVLSRAAAVIARSPGTILHVDMVGTQNNPDGSVITWRDESWQQESPPWARRQVETMPEGTVTEAGSTQTADEVYDAKSNTIYVSTHPNETAQQSQPSWKVVPGPQPGTFVLELRGPGIKKGARVGPGRIRTSVVITAAQAKGLRDGTDVVGFKVSKEAGGLTGEVTVMHATARMQKELARAKTSTSAADPDPSSGSFRDQILALLRSGGATVAGHATIDGQDTIEIDSADGHTTYFVDPTSYAPVELRTKGNGGGTALRFRTYENLPLAGNSDLVSLAAQHPTARIDRDPADYQAAETRLFPHG